MGTCLYCVLPWFAISDFFCVEVQCGLDLTLPSILFQEQAVKEAAAAAERRRLEEELKNCTPEEREARELKGAVAADVAKSRKVTLESIFWGGSLCAWNKTTTVFLLSVLPFTMRRALYLIIGILVCYTNCTDNYANTWGWGILS